MLRIDKRWNIVVCFMVFLAVGGLLAAQPLSPDDVRLVGRGAWMSSSLSAKTAFVNGVLAGAYTVVRIYTWENREGLYPPMMHLVPNDIGADVLVGLIDQAYTYQEFRDWPIAQVIVRWKEVNEFIRRKLNAY